MAMDPRELDDLLGAYALDAVDDVERRLVERYLTLNPRARAEVAEHREVATMLAFSGATAPDGLWDRIAASLDGPAPEPGPELSKVIPMVERRRRRSTPRSVLPWVAGVAAAALIAVGVVSVLDSSDVGDPIATAVEQARQQRETRTVEMVSPDGELRAEVVIDADGHGFFLGEELPALPRDRTYQLWGVIEGNVISLGVLGPTPSTELFTVKGDLAALALTVEQRGGVVSSSEEAFLLGEVV